MRIAIANSKGGVGKSTLTVVLADYLAVFHKLTILVVDLDPQATASCLLKSVKGIEIARQQRQTLAHYLAALGETGRAGLVDFRQISASNLVELQPSRKGGKIGRIDLIASVPSLWFEEDAFVERFYSAGRKPTERLHDALAGGLADLDTSYDVVLIDCPPNYSSLTRAGLMLADAVISPTTADEIALMSLKDFKVHAIEAFADARFQNRHFVVVTRFGRTRDEARLLGVMKKSFNVVDPPIRYSTQVARAIWMIAPGSRQRYRDKYGSFISGVRSDIEALGAAFCEKVLKRKTTG